MTVFCDIVKATNRNNKNEKPYIYYRYRIIFHFSQFTFHNCSVTVRNGFVVCIIIEIV